MTPVSAVNQPRLQSQSRVKGLSTRLARDLQLPSQCDDEYLNSHALGRQRRGILREYYELAARSNVNLGDK